MRSGLAILAVSLILPVCAEDRVFVAAGSRPATARRTTLRSDTNVVLINVRVADRLDRPVMDLRREEFRVFEDKVEQPLSYFTSEETPLSIGLLMDTSKSMRPRIVDTRLALARFLETMNPSDEAFLETFADHPSLVTPFTTNVSEIQDAVTRADPLGRTALLDAIYLAMHQMKRARHPAKALLIVSDGADNSSRYTESEVLRLVRESDIQVYSIGIGEADIRVPGLAFLMGVELLPEIAEQTGGRHFSVRNASELPEVIARAGREMRSRYVLGYTPALRRDGKYRKVDVRIEPRPGLGKLYTHWRRGYYAPSD